jgi:hypothetical protein
MKVGIIGSQFYENPRKIKDTVFKLKQKFGENLYIISNGGKSGASKYAKKFALELDCVYKEHNPSHTVSNLYSAMNESFYDKSYKPRNFFHRNKFLAKEITHLIVFISEGVPGPDVTDTIQQVKKLGKPVVVIT